MDAQRRPAFSCLVYRCHNIGDMIQTYALARLLPRTLGVFRHALSTAPRDRPFVINGFLERDAPPANGASCLFAGVSGPYYRRSEYFQWLSKSPWTIGARDPVTAERLSHAGLPVTLVGCATLTLPPYGGARKGVYSVDCIGPGVRLTHRIPRRATVEAQWHRARMLLETYRTAEAVYTSRLHVALPCLAFGTPVCLRNPRGAPLPERFSIVEAVGARFDRLVVQDVAAQALAYRTFLHRHLGLSMVPSCPTVPMLATADRLSLFDWIRFAAASATQRLLQ